MFQFYRSIETPLISYQPLSHSPKDMQKAIEKEGK